MKTADVEQVAAYWWVPASRVLSWVANGVIPTPWILDGRVLWDAQTLELWEAADYPHTTKPDSKELDRILLAVKQQQELVVTRKEKPK